jgi:hypothetical protein
MAATKDKNSVTESTIVELPEGTLLIKSEENDGATIETKAFRVVQGVVVIKTGTIDGKLDRIYVEYRPGCRLDTETVNGQQTTGTLVRVEK